MIPTRSQWHDWVDEEVHRAREKFPQPNRTFAAMIEEVGEVAKALLDFENGTILREELDRELIQVAAMALRLTIEGDPTFPRTQQQ